MYHCSIKPISRSAGRSATAAAAYRAGVVIECRQYGVTHDYSRKRGVIFSEVVGTELHRAELWNSAEAAENRKNSITAKELELSLPAEAGRDEQIRICREMAMWMRSRYGVACDYSIHRPNPRGDERNYHCHLLFTTRVVTAEGKFGQKTRVLDDKKTGSEETHIIREQWQTLTQSVALDADAWDCRSLRDRGIDREPTTHRGVAMTAMERRGYRTKHKNTDIDAANFDREITKKDLAELTAQAAKAAKEEAARIAEAEEKRQKEMDDYWSSIASMIDEEREKENEQRRLRIAREIELREQQAQLRVPEMESACKGLDQAGRELEQRKQHLDQADKAIRGKGRELVLHFQEAVGNVISRIQEGVRKVRDGLQDRIRKTRELVFRNSSEAIQEFFDQAKRATNSLEQLDGFLNPDIVSDNWIQEGEDEPEEGEGIRIR